MQTIPKSTHLKSERLLFEDIAEDWLRLITPAIKESTYVKYRNLLETYIYPHIGAAELRSLSHELVQAHCSELLCKGGLNGRELSPKTISDIVSVIRCVFQFAQENGIDMPFDISSIRLKRGAKEMRVLSHHEQEALCRYLYANLTSCNLGILICLFSGLRVGEICALQWEDVSWSDKTIHVHQTMQRIQNKSGVGGKTKIIVTPPKSACSIRTIPIPDSLMATIALYHNSDTGYLLSHGNLQLVEPRIMQYRFKQALAASDIPPANFHILRHTFATRCVELGFDVKSLSEILGHANVNITMNRYVHPSMKLKRDNMQRLSSLLPA